MSLYVLPLLSLKYNANSSVFQITLADLKMARFIEWQSGLDWNKYPKLETLAGRVKGNKGLAKWLKERPITDN